MSNPNEIKKQTEIESANLTPEEAVEHIENVKDEETHGNVLAQMSKTELMKWSQLLAKTWSDDNFKQRLLQDPPSVLRECGIEVPPGVDVRVVENTDVRKSTDKVMYVKLPPRPNAGVTDLSEQELATVAGGFCCCFACIRPYSDLAPKYRDVWTA